MPKKGELRSATTTGIGLSVYEMTPKRLFGESRLILAKDFTEAVAKAQKIVDGFKPKDEIGNLELYGSIDS